MAGRAWNLARRSSPRYRGSERNRHAHRDYAEDDGNPPLARRASWVSYLRSEPLPAGTARARRAGPARPEPGAGSAGPGAAQRRRLSHSGPKPSRSATLSPLPEMTRPTSTS